METNANVIEKTIIKSKVPRNYKVIMFNDDFTTMEFVVAILEDIFNKNSTEAYRIMMEIHKNGRGVAGIYPYDIAISKVRKVRELAKQEGFPFKLTVEEE